MLNLAYASALRQESNADVPIDPQRNMSARGYVIGMLLQNGTLGSKGLGDEETLSELVDPFMPRHDVMLHDRMFKTSNVIGPSLPDRHNVVALYPDAPARPPYWLERPTVYYRSESHVVWRALLTLVDKNWYAKGMFGTENSADAPIALQKLFSVMSNRGIVSQGTISAHKVVEQTINMGPRDTKRAAQIMKINNVEPSGIRIVPSKSRLFPKGKQPKLAEPLDEWKQPTSQYGEVVSTVYPSADGRLNYVINAARHEQGEMQHWLATAELNSDQIEATDLGLPTGFPQIASELLAPPLDYHKEKEGYASRQSGATLLDRFIKRSLAASQSQPR